MQYFRWKSPADSCSVWIQFHPFKLGGWLDMEDTELNILSPSMLMLARRRGIYLSVNGGLVASIRGKVSLFCKPR